MRMLRAIVIAGLACNVAQTAQAQSAAGWYGGIEAGANWMRDSDVSINGYASSTTSHAAGPVLLGQAGYGFTPSALAQLKVEGELGWRRNDADKDSSGNSLHGATTSKSVMTNVVGEFLPEGAVHPFVGVGVGGARVDGSAHSSTGYSIQDTVLAYQGVAGVGYDLSKDVGLKLAYRYFATEDVDVKHDSGATGSASNASHALTAGVTFRFGGSGRTAATVAPVTASIPAAPMPMAAETASAPDYRRQFMVFFEWNRSDLTEQAHIEVEHAAAAAKAGAAPRIDVSGYTDRSGPEPYNKRLSVERARKIKDTLVSLGVPADAIKTVGKGESEPLVPTKDGVREARNRRVEIVLP